MTLRKVGLDVDQPSIGIFAYGSLIDDPGDEIAAARSKTIKDVETPFYVEFARSSSGRGGAPTLVPVEEGGKKVKGQVFIVSMTEEEASNALWRRETNKVGSAENYKRPDTPGKNSVLVERIEGVAGIGVVLYTKICATIKPLTAENLAKLAIASVKKADPSRDGISYLMNAQKHGIITALSPEYEAEILRQTRCQSLELALEAQTREDD